MSWMMLWKISLIVSIACFAVMAVIVSIGGALDVRRLFQRLRDDETK